MNQLLPIISLGRHCSLFIRWGHYRHLLVQSHRSSLLIYASAMRNTWTGVCVALSSLNFIVSFRCKQCPKAETWTAVRKATVPLAAALWLHVNAVFRRVPARTVFQIDLPDEPYIQPKRELSSYGFLEAVRITLTLLMPCTRFEDFHEQTSLQSGEQVAWSAFTCNCFRI
jgi:hypothetical protein